MIIIMRKTMLFAAMCVAAVMNAQSFNVGPSAAFELNSPTDMKSEVGFNVGACGEMFFGDDTAKGLFLDASLLFDAKNWKSADIITPRRKSARSTATTPTD